MRTYLLKKLLSHDNKSFLCTAWNKSSGILACGGEDGGLEIFHIDAQGFNEKNQMFFLEVSPIHKENITCLDWAEKTNSLVTGDKGGIFIIWKYCGEFMKEQVVNKNSSGIACAKWSSCAQQICLGLSNGGIKVISSDGALMWNQDHYNVLSLIWCGDSILTTSKNSTVTVLDRRGYKIDTRSVFDEKETLLNSEISAIDWYNGESGWRYENCPVLAICLQSGACRLLKNERDEEPIVLGTEMAISCAKWNRDGSVIAVGGSFLDSGLNQIVNIINFYSLRGKHINSIRLGDGSMGSLSWNDDNSILAVVLQNEIIFVATRHDHHWTRCGDSIIYSFPLPFSFSYIIRFWNQSSKIIVKKLVKNMELLQACGERCCIVSKFEDTLESQVTLYNSIGTPVDSRSVNFTPSFCQMNGTHVVVASHCLLFLWEYHRAGTKLDTLRDIARSDHQEDKLFFVGDEIVEMKDKVPATFQGEISGICLSAYLGIGRTDGSIGLYTVPALSVVTKVAIPGIPHCLRLNMNSQKMAVVDFVGNLSLINIRENGPSQVIPSKSNVWDLQWGQDNPDLLAVMDKSNLYVLRGEDAQEVFESGGYILSFCDLRITTFNLDRLSVFPDYPNESLVNVCELKSIRIVKSLLEAADFDSAKSYISENSHEFLWNILGESALQHLEWDVAELSYTMCHNYGLIQFIKSLRTIEDDDLKLAKVMVLFREYRKAENIYRAQDRRDLVLKLWTSVGNYFQVNKVLEKNYDDAEIVRNNNLIGNHYADLHKWREAINYLKLSNTDPRIVDCYYAAEDFEGLKGFARDLPGSHPSLPKIAKLFEKAGMFAEAIEAHRRMGNVGRAIDVCIEGNQWRFAKQLAQGSGSVDLPSLLSRNISGLLQSNQLFEAISLCQETGNYREAARFVVEFVQVRKTRLSPVTKKKLYVLAGFLWNERSDDVVCSYDKPREDTVGNPWVMAEAYHFLLRTNNFIRRGNYESGFWCAYRLLGFLDVLESRIVHSLLALCACLTNRFKICSREFLILERAGNLEGEYRDLSFRIFSGERGKGLLNSDGTDLREDLLKPICYFSGRPVSIESYWQCRVCKHGADHREIRKTIHCPLCHSKREDLLT